MAWPFTLTRKPLPAQNGRRRANVNFFGEFRENFSIADSPTGKPVFISTLTPSASQFAVEGTNKPTQSFSLDS